MQKNGTIVNLLFALFIVLYEFVFNAVYSRATGSSLEEAAREVIYGGKTDPVLGAVIAAAALSLKGLYWLSLGGRGDKISSIPAAITRLENCAKLDISNNRRTSFPAEVLKMKKLKVLDISGNPIRDMPKNLPFTVKE